MRFLCLLFLIAVGACIAMFVVQNQHEVALNFWDRSLTVSIPVLVGAVYVLGMLTGWSVVGLLRRSLATATEYRERHPVNV
jgi:hypothetical protein